MSEVLPDLLGAISDLTGGKVAIVIGAGSSRELPTNLPLSKKCSEDAHDKLVADGVLSPGECVDPSDLSILADVVYAKSSKQEKLVSRLPIEAFRNAQPNEGHTIAAALLVEQAVIDILSLNFDHAQRHALPNVSAGSRVSIVNGPQDHDRLGVCNFIYLHRSADAGVEEWILRSVQLEEAWRGNWEQVITQRVSSTPHLVFAGLGYPAKVLVESVQQLKTALPTGHKLYYVDPGQLENSKFAESLAVSAEQHIQLGWIDFMRLLGARLVEEHIRDLRDRCAVFSVTNQIDHEDCSNFLGELKSLGLLTFGRIRAVWQLDTTMEYLPYRGCHYEQYVDLILSICLIERTTGCKGKPDRSGNVVLHKGGKAICTLVPISGRGIRTISMIEPVFTYLESEIGIASKPTPIIFLLSGVQGTEEESKLPPDIVMGEQSENLVIGTPVRAITNVLKLRGNPESILSLIGQA